MNFVVVELHEIGHRIVSSLSLSAEGLHVVIGDVLKITLGRVVWSIALIHLQKAFGFGFGLLLLLHFLCGIERYAEWVSSSGLLREIIPLPNLPSE